MATERSSVPLTHTQGEARRGASSVCSCVCLISKPCVKWRGNSVLLTAPTSLHYTDCTPENWPGQEGSKTETVQTDGKGAIQGEVKKRQTEGN